MEDAANCRKFWDEVEVRKSTNERVQINSVLLGKLTYTQKKYYHFEITFPHIVSGSTAPLDMSATSKY